MENSKSKKVKFINKKTMIAALDIGKGFHFAYFRSPNGDDTKPFPFCNSKKDFDKFWTMLCQFKKDHNLEDVIVGFESSGPYAEPLCHYLKSKPVKLVQINPMHSKKIKELTGNSPNKTDKKDPRVIADVISLGHSLTLVVPEGAAAQLRRLTHARESTIKKRTAAINQLQDLVFIIFPEFLTIMKGIATKTAFYLMERYPIPEDIVSLGLETLAADIQRVSRGRMGRERVEELFKAAQMSIGVREGRRGILLGIKHLISRIKSDDQFISDLEKEMEEWLTGIPYSRSILSIKGVGVVTVAGLIGEVGDFRKFSTRSEVMKLAGLDLYEISSGKHKGQLRISKRGRALIRKLLFFASMNVVKSKGIMNKPYQQMLDRGMPKLKALIAISRKLLGLIFALVRDNTVYIEDYSNEHHFKLAA